MIDKRPGGRTVTSLIISQADVTDSGNYTCDPASNYSKWVIVHVTTGLYLVRIYIRILGIHFTIFSIYTWVECSSSHSIDTVVN